MIRVGRHAELLRPVVYANDAKPIRTDEKSRPHVTQSSSTASQLVSRQRGVIEEFNNKVKLTARKSYGFRAYQAIEISLYHNLETLPEPEFTHRFW